MCIIDSLTPPPHTSTSHFTSHLTSTSSPGAGRGVHGLLAGRQAGVRGGLPHWPPLLLQVGPRTYTMHQDLFKIFFDSRFMYFFHRMYPASTCWWRRRRRSCPRSEVEEQDHPEAQETARELPGALRHGRQQVWGVDMQ